MQPNNGIVDIGKGLFMRLETGFIHRCKTQEELMHLMHLTHPFLMAEETTEKRQAVSNLKG